jgi:PKD repeat protein
MPYLSRIAKPVIKHNNLKKGGGTMQQKKSVCCLVTFMLALALLVCAVPVVCFADECNREFTFDATRSYDPNKEALSYLWDFGDGTTSTEPVVKHLYERAGDYTVTLTVKDTSGLECDTSVTTQQVKVKMPPQARCSGPESVCVGSAVTFDGSASTGGAPLTYTWDFGDGTKGEGSVVSKTYERGGNYTVTLIVESASETGTAATTSGKCAKCKAAPSCNRAICTRTVKVNSAPMAKAGEDMDMCFAANQDLKVAFDAGRSSDPDGDALTYTWNFGDGATESGRSVSHVYGKDGDYRVSLTVNDGQGSPCSSSGDTIEVRLNRGPIANAGKDIVACVGSTVTLDGSLSQGASLYSWDFGDGETGQGERVTHSYAKGGYYKAVLKVDDGKGTRCSTSSSLVNVMVNEAPEVTLKNVESTCLGKAVRFDASAKGSGLTYAWDFGDGTVIEDGRASETHTYTKGGAYTVRVTVDDKKGTPCSMATAVSRVKINSPPIANCGPNLVCCIGKETLFDGSGSSDPDGDALTYLWDFGDGATAEGARVTHAYSKSGKYTVTLTVDDGSGTGSSPTGRKCGKCGCSSDRCSFEAVVSEHPVAIIEVR